MGKEAIDVCTAAFRADRDISPDLAPTAAEFLHKGFKFIFGDPDAKVSFLLFSRSVLLN